MLNSRRTAACSADPPRSGPCTTDPPASLTCGSQLTRLVDRSHPDPDAAYQAERANEALFRAGMERLRYKEDGGGNRPLSYFMLTAEYY
jgi:hypothetical protein